MYRIAITHRGAVLGVTVFFVGEAFVRGVAEDAAAVTFQNGFGG